MTFRYLDNRDVIKGVGFLPRVTPDGFVTWELDDDLRGAAADLGADL
jgi:hypothetical protein